MGKYCRFMGHDAVIVSLEESILVKCLKKYCVCTKTITYIPNINISIFKLLVHMHRHSNIVHKFIVPCCNIACYGGAG